MCKQLQDKNGTEPGKGVVAPLHACGTEDEDEQQAMSVEQLCALCESLEASGTCLPLVASENAEADAASADAPAQRPPSDPEPSPESALTSMMTALTSRLDSIQSSLQQQSSRIGAIETSRADGRFSTPAQQQPSTSPTTRNPSV